MKIFLDFDGTIVEHEYPKIGKYNSGALEVINKLYKTHEIILNTYRADCQDGTLSNAINYLKQRGILFHTVLNNKKHPPIWSIEQFKSSGEIYIDDISNGIPLKTTVALHGHKMVDWEEINKQFIENGIY